MSDYSFESALATHVFLLRLYGGNSDRLPTPVLQHATHDNVGGLQVVSAISFLLIVRLSHAVLVDVPIPACLA
jgi:hypothetical protein